MKIAIFGSSGKLGRLLCFYLTKKRLNYTPIIRRESAKDLLPKNKKYELAQNFNQLRKALEDKDIIINCAGRADFSQTYLELYQSNVQATKDLLLATGPKTKKFIHISSIAVHQIKEGQILNEDSPLLPNTDYGKTKLLAEKEVLKYKNKFNVIILRPGMIYGPEFKEGYSEVLKKIKENKMPIIGDGKNYIPLVYYLDLLDAIYLSIKKRVPSGSTYIIVQQPQLTQEELFRLAAQKLQASTQFKKIHPLIIKLILKITNSNKINPQMIDQLYKDRRFDCTKAQKELSWKPKTNHKENISKVIEQFLKEKII